MAFVVEQKIGKYVYLYEVESYWDSHKKQSRQRRRYIGKKDLKTGEIIRPRKGMRPLLSRSFGHIYLLRKIAERIGLSKALEYAFGEEKAKDILSLVFYEISEARPLYLFKLWAEDTYLDEGISSSSQKISELLEKIGRMEEERERFFWKWIKMQGEIKAIVFDITSISSYSRFIESLEWGYNRDGEDLAQINFGIAIGGESELPLSYRIYPGSIPDVSTLKNICIHLKSFGLKEFLFVLDRGFWSKTNIAEMEREGIGFILPIPFGTKIAKSLISKERKALSSPLSGFYFQKQALFHIKRGIELSGINLYAHLYLNEKRRAEEVEGFMRKLVEIEEGVKVRGLRSREEVEAFIEERMKGGKKLFSVKVRGGEVKILRRLKAISRLMGRMGKMIIVTNRKELGREEILLFYRRKDRIEKLFDTMKNELEGGRLRVSSKEAMEGRIFLSYLSLIIWSAIAKVMKEKELFKNYTVSEVLYELKKLKVVEMIDGRRYLTEISKKQRFLYEKFDISIPVGT